MQVDSIFVNLKTKVFEVMMSLKFMMTLLKLIFGQEHACLIENVVCYYLEVNSCLEFAFKLC